MGSLRSSLLIFSHREVSDVHCDVSGSNSLLDLGAEFKCYIFSK
ncbi:hypothetical protein HanRHA438_Chr05g0230901 [Helianthus annuus]|nr:hypothetical protein HanRHA438_Chr05g0230901 [Helianthus annuus]